MCNDEGGYASAPSLGALVVDREGNLTETANVLTRAEDAKA